MKYRMIFTHIILETHPVWRHLCLAEAKRHSITQHTMNGTSEYQPNSTSYLPISESILTYNHRTLPWETKHDEKFLQSHLSTILFPANSYLAIFLLWDKLHSTQTNVDKTSTFKNSWQQPYEAQCSIYSRMIYLHHTGNPLWRHFYPSKIQSQIKSWPMILSF